MDRRHFLKAAAAVTAFGSIVSKAHASDVLTSQEFRGGLDIRKLRKLRNKRIAIIGGGISGLTCAYELSKAGIHYNLFEARSKLGGRVETIRANDRVDEFEESQTCGFRYNKELYFNSGAARISQTHRGVLSYCKELRVRLEVMSNENPGGLFASQQLSQYGPLRIRQIQNSLRGELAELCAKQLQTDAFSGLVPVEEIPNYLAMLYQFGDLDSEFNFNQSSRLGFDGEYDPLASFQAKSAIPLSDISKTDFFSQYKLHLGNYFDQQATMLQPVGGIDQIIAAMAKHVYGQVHLDTAVTKLQQTASGSALTYQQVGSQYQQEFDVVIVATPGNVALNIENDFSTDVVSALQTQQYAKPAKVAFQSPRFWEEDYDIYGGLSYTDEDIFLLWYPSNGIGKRQGIIVGAYNPGVVESQTFSQLSMNERVNLAIEQGSNLHPEYPQKVHNGITRAWHNTPFIEGGWSLSTPDSRLLLPDNNYLFAGDHLSHKAGWMEGAIASAHNALNNLTDIS